MYLIVPMYSEFEEMRYKIIMNLSLILHYTHIRSISLESGVFILVISVFQTLKS